MTRLLRRSLRGNYSLAKKACNREQDACDPHDQASKQNATIIGAEVRWSYAYDGQGDDDGYPDDALGQSGCRARLHRQWQRLELELAALWASGGSRRQRQ
jgi:hypothetical protein